MHRWRRALAVGLSLLAALAPEPSRAQTGADATDRWYDGSRLPLGMDSLEIYLVRADGRYHLGVRWDELERVDRDGAPAVRRTYRETSRLLGAHHEVAYMTYPELRPLSDRLDADRRKGHAVYRADSIVGWYQAGDGARREFSVTADPSQYDGQAVDLLVQAADLAPGFRREFRAFLPSEQRAGTMRAWVTGSDTVPGIGGRETECWVVELDFDGVGSTMWVDKRTRALHRQVIRVAPGAELVMERHRGA